MFFAESPSQSSSLSAAGRFFGATVGGRRSGDGGEADLDFGLGPRLAIRLGLLDLEDRLLRGLGVRLLLRPTTRLPADLDRDL